MPVLTYARSGGMFFIVAVQLHPQQLLVMQAGIIIMEMSQPVMYVSLFPAAKLSQVLLFIAQHIFLALSALVRRQGIT
jgi:hypothetical protein